MLGVGCRLKPFLLTWRIPWRIVTRRNFGPAPQGPRRGGREGSGCRGSRSRCPVRPWPRVPRGAHYRRPFLGFVIAAADPDESDEVMALVLVEAGDELANLLSVELPGAAVRTSVEPSSIGFDPESGSVTPSFTSNSRARRISCRLCRGRCPCCPPADRGNNPQEGRWVRAKRGAATCFRRLRTLRLGALGVLRAQAQGFP